MPSDSAAKVLLQRTLMSFERLEAIASDNMLPRRNPH
jgi:hypothetical protein